MNWIKKIFDRMGAPVDTNLSTDIANVQADTDALQIDIGVAGAGLTDLGGFSTGAKAEIQAECDGAITANATIIQIAADVTTGGPVDVEVETTTLDAGDGSIADNVRAGLLTRYIADALAAITGVNSYQEAIPASTFTLAAIDTTLTADPPAPDVENTVLAIAYSAGNCYVLRGLWVNTTSFGTGASITYKLWLRNGAATTEVDGTIVTDTGWQNLTDLFGLQEVHADSIYVTAQTDVGSTGAASGMYHYATAA